MNDTPKQRQLALAWSRDIAARIDAEPKACWRNSMLALLTQEDLPSGYYVEGWCVPSHGVPIEHGWVECEEAVSESVSVIDPTLVLCGDEIVAYFPAERWDRAAVRAFWNQPLPHVRRDGRGGWSIQVYRDAWDAALAYASLSSERKSHHETGG